MTVSQPALMISCFVFFGCLGPDEGVLSAYPASTEQEAPFPYRASTEADLTGDGVPETLRLVASGQGPFDLVVSFSIWSEGQEAYDMSWEFDPELFALEPEDIHLECEV